MTDTEYWFRYEDNTYASVDEWDNVHTHTELVLRQFEVASHTPKGVWLFTFGSVDLNGQIVSNTRRQKRFVLGTATKMFALPTKQLALESFIARKERQASIYRARVNKAESMISRAKMEMMRI